jgi:5'-methylthioadenosine phosphorylase
VNFRANIYALKEAGCTHIIATTAVGSLREQIGRGDLVILDQFIDFTKHRFFSFFEEFKPHQPQHTPMAEPFSVELRNLFLSSCEELGLRYHPRGTVVTIEGPRFSTKAESNMFRQWGADVINMSIAPEVALANEAGIPYGAIAMSTDYDCWKEDEVPVTWEAIIEIFKTNASNVTNLLLSVIEKMKDDGCIKLIKEKIRTVPNWPKHGIMFRDITTLLKDAESFQKTIDLLFERYKNVEVDVVAGIESRGFIVGAVLANKLSKGFVPVRKKGKLPAEVVSEEYQLEYGTDKVEIHKDAISQGQKVLLVDDLIATGGTALATCNLIKKLGGKITECCFVIDLPDLGGKQKLISNGYSVFNLVEFEGE